MRSVNTIKYCRIAVADPQVIHMLKETKSISGVTLLNNELYVLRDDSNIQVYSTGDFTALRYLFIPGMVPVKIDHITSCEQKQCIYLATSNNDNNSIHRLELDLGLSEWAVRYRTQALSVTRSANVLATCRDDTEESCKLVELSSDDGSCLSEITLEADIEYPWHCIQLDSGMYLVCHGMYSVNSGVSHVDTDGRITRSNKGDGGLDWPCHLASLYSSLMSTTAELFSSTHH